MNVIATIYDDSDTAIEVTGEYYRGMRGQRDRYGAPLEPDDEPEMEILDAVDEHGTTRNLSAKQETDAMVALWESLD
jgi:hypothetical protein